MESKRYQLPGLVLAHHWFDVPVDYGNPDSGTVRIYAREVVSPDKRDESDLPWLVFFQGGPGFPSPRPSGKSGWLKRALKDYRVLLLDQRGTGRSSPVTFQTLARFSSAAEQADYLKNFRADSIVRDAELIRKKLAGGQKWSILGQSYGGFCAVHYLSAAPEGLKEVMITGGLPPLTQDIDDIYRATYKRAIAKNERYYRRYPEDREAVREIMQHLGENEVVLPAGGKLTPERFQQLGIELGMSDGWEHIHYLLEGAFVEGQSGKELNFLFLREIEHLQQFETNPIYVLLHEPCYLQQEAGRWSAQRVRGEYPDFSPDRQDAPFFTGEMIYPWMFDVYPKLAPLRHAAEILSEYEDWPRLYDLGVLRSNSVPCVAAVYYEDMYVETAFSEDAAREIAGVRTWVTNEYEHNGLRADGENVVGRLIDMLKGEV